MCSGERLSVAYSPCNWAGHVWLRWFLAEGVRISTVDPWGHTTPRDLLVSKYGESWRGASGWTVLTTGRDGTRMGNFRISGLAKLRRQA